MPKKISKTQEKPKKKVAPKTEDEPEEKPLAKVATKEDEEEEKEDTDKDPISPTKKFAFEGALEEAFATEVEDLPHDSLTEDDDDFSDEELGTDEWEE